MPYSRSFTNLVIAALLGMLAAALVAPAAPAWRSLRVPEAVTPPVVEPAMREPAQTVPTEMMVPMPAEPAELPQTPGDEQPSDAVPFRDQPSAPAWRYAQPTAGQSGTSEASPASMETQPAARPIRSSGAVGPPRHGGLPIPLTDEGQPVPQVGKAGLRE